MIKPIESLLLWLLNFYYGIIGSYGLSILAISVTVTVVLSPFMNLLKKFGDRPREIQKQMKPYIEKIKALDLPREKKAHMTDALYRQFKYSPLYAFADILPLMIQLPFLMAMYWMVINNGALLAGHGFLFIRDLSQPDHLLWGVNLLPVLMTLINIAAACMMPERGKKELIQAVFLAIVFLALLYNVPSAAVLYWTFNNVMVLVKNCVVKLRGAK